LNYDDVMLVVQMTSTI